MTVRESIRQQRVPKPEEKAEKEVETDAAKEAPKAEARKEAPTPEKKEEKEVKIDAAKEAFFSLSSSPPPTPPTSSAARIWGGGGRGGGGYVTRGGQVGGMVIIKEEDDFGTVLSSYGVQVHYWKGPGWVGGGWGGEGWKEEEERVLENARSWIEDNRKEVLSDVVLRTVEEQDRGRGMIIYWCVGACVCVCERERERERESERARE
jgi:hypothetical protein